MIYYVYIQEINDAPTSPECLGVPVESSSWGAVKYLYRFDGMNAARE